MIVIDETSVERICYLVNRLADEQATKEETDEFMRLMHITQSIPQLAWDCYITESDISWAVSIAEICIAGPLIRYLDKLEQTQQNNEQGVKPAA
jgi:hypothetical protein